MEFFSKIKKWSHHRNEKQLPPRRSGKNRLLNNSLVEIIFTVIFFIVLFIPMSNINLDKESKYENRNLAKYQPFFKGNGKINYEWGKDFEEFFNDRFNNRDRIIAFYDSIKFRVETSKVLKGKDGWLFYRGTTNPIQAIENYQNIAFVPEEELQEAATYLQSINDWCNKNNKKFYFFIAPDKHKIYEEYLPSYMRKIFPDSQSRTMQLIKYLQENTDVKVIYPADLLIEHKKDGYLLYWKTDSHWNELGAYWGYFALMQEISKDFNTKPIIIRI
jgi:hypothetical protein